MKHWYLKIDILRHRDFFLSFFKPLPDGLTTSGWSFLAGPFEPGVVLISSYQILISTGRSRIFCHMGVIDLTTETHFDICLFTVRNLRIRLDPCFN